MSNLVTVSQAVGELEQLLLLLSGSDQSFADSLINGQYGFKKRGFLTEKQSPHVFRLIEKAVAGGAPPVSEAVNIKGIVDLLAKAAVKLKFPSIVMDWKGGKLKVWKQGAKAKLPGSLGVSYDGDWLGRVTPQGNFQGSVGFSHLPAKADLVSFLQEFAAAPAQVAGELGRLSGTCCFCHKALTDGKSLAVGYGKTCAENYQLEYGVASLTLKNLDS